MARALRGCAPQLAAGTAPRRNPALRRRRCARPSARDNRRMCDPRHTADGGSLLESKRWNRAFGGLHDVAVVLSVRACPGGRRAPSVVVGKADRADRGRPAAQGRRLCRGPPAAPRERAPQSIHSRARAAPARPIASMFVFFSLPVEMLGVAVAFIAVMAGMLAAAPE